MRLSKFAANISFNYKTYKGRLRCPLSRGCPEVSNHQNDLIATKRINGSSAYDKDKLHDFETIQLAISQPRRWSSILLDSNYRQRLLLNLAIALSWKMHFGTLEKLCWSLVENVLSILGSWLFKKKFDGLTWIVMPYWMTEPMLFWTSLAFCFFSTSAACWKKIT